MVNYHYIDTDDAVGYLKWVLEYIKVFESKPPSLLDIGAAHGHFAELYKGTFPEAYIHCVECNQLDKHYLENKSWDVTFACLGSKPTKKTFYMSEGSEVGGGSSFYRENTSAFDKTVEQVCEIQRLDDLSLGQYDFVKLDTQGSEVDIINGGTKTIRNAKYLLIEMSFTEYNQGGCLIDDVMNLTRELGFRLVLTTGPVKGVHWFNYKPVQVDGLFVREDSEMIKMI